MQIRNCASKCAHMRLCVCVCVRERERERKYEAILVSRANDLAVIWKRAALL